MTEVHVVVLLVLLGLMVALQALSALLTWCWEQHIMRKRMKRLQKIWEEHSERMRENESNDDEGSVRDLEGLGR